MQVFQINDNGTLRNFTTKKAALDMFPDVVPVETIIPDGVLRRELGSGEIVDIPQVELDQMAAEHMAEEASRAATQWIRDRQTAYLSLEEQLDMLYWDMKNGTSTFVEHRDAVKAAYPKPNGG